jgi:hypothetical protein
MPTATKRRVTLAEREMTSLLVRYDIEPTPGNVATLTSYVRRTHSAHWYGAIGAVAAGTLGWLGSTGESGGLSLSRILIGYLVGAALAEVFSPARRAEGAVHAASLVTRDPDQLLPRWGRWLPWVALAPCLAAPLLILGDHPTGTFRFHDQTGSARVTEAWFPTTMLVTTALLAAAGLVLWRLALHRLSRRRLPADRPGAARLDLFTRALSARAVSGTAAALGLLLLAGLASVSGSALVSETCTTPRDCHPLYAWHDHYDLIQSAGSIAGLWGLFLFLFSRIRRRVDPALLGPVSPPVTDPVTGPVP